MDIVDALPARQAGLFTTLFCKIAGADPETLSNAAPPDTDTVQAVALLMIFTWLYQTGLFFLISQKIAAPAGPLRPELLVFAAFLATFILLIDAFQIMRSGWYASGLAELRRGGLDLGGGFVAQVKAGIFLIIRLTLSVGLAQLTAIFVSLLIFNADIDAYIQGQSAQANAALIAQAATMVDRDIQQTRDDVVVEAKQVAGLSTQLTTLRQAEVDPLAADPQIQQAQAELAQRMAEKAKADEAVVAAETFAANELGGIKATAANSGHPGNGVRRRAANEQVQNARVHAEVAAKALDAARLRVDALREQLASGSEALKEKAQAQRPGFETALSTEQGKLTALQDKLAAQVTGREAAIQRAIEAAPNYVPPNDGLIGQLAALEHVAAGDNKITAVVILIDVVSFGFELAAVLAKITSYVPTTYAALLVRDQYLQVVRIADELTAQLERTPRPTESEPADGPAARETPTPDRYDPVNDNIFATVTPPDTDPFTPPDSPVPPPKRPRGRPRKTPLNGG